MIKSKKYILISLIIPIIALLTLAIYKKYNFLTGYQIILPITGYDPRDLLSGYYLNYNIEYDVTDICLNSAYGENKHAYICLDPKIFSYTRPYNCNLLIKGACIDRRFRAGIERYYVPKEDAKRLEKLIRSNKASIVLSVPKNGDAQVKDLLINGKSWKDQ